MVEFWQKLHSSSWGKINNKVSQVSQTKTVESLRAHQPLPPPKPSEQIDNYAKSNHTSSPTNYADGALQLGRREKTEDGLVVASLPVCVEGKGGGGDGGIRSGGVGILLLLRGFRVECHQGSTSTSLSDLHLFVKAKNKSIIFTASFPFINIHT